jgi:hypothetical protein
VGNFDVNEKKIGSIWNKKLFPRVKYDNLTVFYGTKCGSKNSSFFKEENDLIDSQVMTLEATFFFSRKPNYFLIQL